MSLSNKKGFTLVELLIVLALVGLASSIVLPNLWGQLDKIRYLAEKRQVTALLEYARLYAFYNNQRLLISSQETSLTITLPKLETSEVSSGEDDKPSSLEDDIDSEVPSSQSVRIVKQVHFKHVKLNEKDFEISPLSYIAFSHSSLELIKGSNGES
ncbi:MULTISPECIES: pilus assembly FimT family protein [unclassified Pseudoalteromonas]|uniref:pilus assembly FimT family protein n=1 Tax=Pseudoalteromonas TaxID=53246 RepID=UPI00224B0F76|nr:MULTISPECIES: type II secretion system protein [unclassified Pseudoalteromonas]MCX2766922.1 type II secretion system protein [Pseudoalteromonas sp. B530]